MASIRDFRDRKSHLAVLCLGLLLAMCGGRSALHGDRKFDGDDGLIPGHPQASAGASVGASTNGGAGGGSNVGGNVNVGGSQAGAAATAGAGGNSGSAGSVTDTVLTVDDQAVSSPSTLPVWHTSVTTDHALALACSSENCLVFWALRMGARFARVTFDGKWLDENPGQYVGRVAQIALDPMLPRGMAVASDGTRYLLLWQEFNGSQRRWVVRRVQAATGSWVDSEPLPLSSWTDVRYGNVALAWDGEHYLAVIPQGMQSHAVLIGQGGSQLSVLSEMPLGTGSTVQLSAASAARGQFVVVWNNGSMRDQPEPAGAVLLSSTNNTLSKPIAWTLPLATHHKNAALTSKAGQYLFSWQEKGKTQLQVATHDTDPETTWQLGSASMQEAGAFAFDGNAYVGVSNGGTVAALDSRTLAPRTAPSPLEFGFPTRIAGTAKNSALVAHWNEKQQIHVHTIEGYRASDAALRMGSLAADQTLAALATDGSQYLVAWTEEKQFWFRRFHVDGTPLDTAAWTVPEFGLDARRKLHLRYASGRFVALWWSETIKELTKPRVGILDPIARKLSDVQLLGSKDDELRAQELMTDGKRVWVTLIEMKREASYWSGAWLRVATLEPGATEFRMSERLLPDGVSLAFASIAPVEGGHVAVWEGKHQSAPDHTIHGASFDSAFHLDETRGLTQASAYDVYHEGETVTGLRVVAHSESPRALMVFNKDYGGGILVELLGRRSLAIQPTQLPRLSWATDIAPSVLPLRGSCWLVSWMDGSHYQDYPLSSRRICDNAGQLDTHSAVQTLKLSGERGILGKGYYGATHDNEHVAFALEANDPELGAKRVRLAVFEPKP